MKRAWCLLFLALIGARPAQAQLWGLPGWANNAVRDAATVRPPEGTDAWVLLDQTLVSYRGAGELRKTRTRVVRVLSKQGVGEGTYRSLGFGKTATKNRKLKGWNLRPDGSTRKIDRDDLVSIDADLYVERTVSSAVSSEATLPDVEVGSILAFESQETLKLPMGPVDLIFPLEQNPIRRYVLEVEIDLAFLSVSKEKLISFRLEPRNLKVWAGTVQQGERLVEMTDVPAWPKDESWAVTGLEHEPFISLRFDDPLMTGCPDLSNWDSYAKWVQKNYSPKIEKVHPVPTEGLGLRDALVRLGHWMQGSLSYRQVYLSLERGWVPEFSVETLRRRYGDCKDLTTCLLGGARALQLEGSPVTARLGRGRIPVDAPVNAYLFNHIIAAIRLEHSLGFPAEVQTPRGRFLLVDATAQTTPLGWLPTAHRGARLMICTAEGATWVDVPDSALELEKVDYRLEGQISPEGVLTGTLRIVESGNALGLQGIAKSDGAKGLQRALLGFAPQAMPTLWEVASIKPPVQPGDPFETILRIEYAGAQVKKGSEWELNLPCVVAVPPPFKRSKQNRRFPIGVTQGIEYRWEASLQIGTEVTPVRADGRLTTPLRKAAWKATIIKPGLLKLTLDHQRAPAYWGLEEQDAGLETLRKDRSNLLRFMEESLAFVPTPGTASGHK